MGVADRYYLFSCVNFVAKSARRKRKQLNSLEKFHIYKISENNLHVNDTNTATHNPMQRTLHELNTI
jgi:hypothetical protein